MTVRALYRPGRDPIPDGNALPRGGSAIAQEQRAALEDMLTDPASSARVPRPLHASDDQYGEMLLERMRTITLSERITMEIELTQRFKRLHTYDYDPLRY